MRLFLFLKKSVMMLIMVVKYMKKKNKIILSILIVIAIIVLGSLIIIINHKNIFANKEDALKFKEEYESLNNTVRESDGAKYNSITINKDNPIVYINTNEAIDILNNKKAIIYIGAAWCPWCRNSVPVMLDVAKALNIDTIYYLNLDEEKSNFKVENSKLIEINHGTNGYYKLLEVLKDHLKDYVLTDEDGNSYDTKEKRIYMPYVITAKNGKVVSEHLSTVSLDKEQTKYDSLTKEQYKELYDIYYKMFDELYNSGKSCSLNEDCN